VIKIIEEIDRVERRVHPRLPRHHVAELVDDIKTGLRVPIAVTFVATIDHRPDMVLRLIANVLELEKVTGRLEVHAPHIGELSFRNASRVGIHARDLAAWRTKSKSNAPIAQGASRQRRTTPCGLDRSILR